MSRYFVILSVLAILGCQKSFIAHEVQKPVLVTEGDDSETAGQRHRFEEIVGCLEREREERKEQLQTLADRRTESHARLREALGDAYVELLASDSVELSLYLSRPDVTGPVVPIYAVELCRHVLHSEQVQNRIHVIDLALAEAHAWLDLSDDYGRFHAMDVQNETLLFKLEFIAEDSFSPPSEPSRDDVVQSLDDEFRLAREAAETQQVALALAKQEVAEKLAARREAERLAARQQAGKEAARREAERVALLKAAEEETARQTQKDEIRRLARQQADALKIYGGTYHHFFEGKYKLVLDALDQAIALDSSDPRYFYFRGLARLRLGQSEEADRDFREGGELERQGAFGVGAALERIQGRDRLTIERYRP